MSPAPPLTCLIIDDNEMNRLTLEHFVALTASLTLVASLGGGLAGLQYLKDHPRVDLLLLDIEMPHLSGLDLVRLLPPPLPAVILITTHREFAVDAFDLRVADYLVKPVEYARFLQAVARATAHRPGPASAPGGPPARRLQPGSDEQSLFVKVNGKLVRLDFGEVLFIEALSTYSVVVTATQKHIVYATLKSLEQRLPFAHFQRVHRSYIVNTRRIEAVEDHLLRMGPYEVPVGKSYQEGFYRKLRNL